MTQFGWAAKDEAGAITRRGTCLANRSNQSIWFQILERLHESTVFEWRRNQPLPESSPFGLVLGESLWRLDTELNYTTAAPPGHFPWVGVSSSQLGEILNQQNCGSCTIDAIYPVNDRYYDYLPALFMKLNQSFQSQ